MTNGQESPIFLKSYRFRNGSSLHTKKFPAHQRFVMAKRIEEVALSFDDCLLWATKAGKAEGLAPLANADFHLERLKVYSRLPMQLKLSSFGQYEHLARTLDESSGARPQLVAEGRGAREVVMRRDFWQRSSRPRDESRRHR